MTSERIPLCEDVIAIQRQMIAQKVLEAKGLTAASRTTALPAKPKRVLPLSPKIPHPYIPAPVYQPQVLAVKPVSISFPQSSPPQRKLKHSGDGGDDKSMSTATMTTMSHEPTPPLHLSTFKPAYGCISADDFLIRCFVARLRSGVTVFKHCRSKFTRWTRPCTLKIEDDGQSLIWVAATESQSTEDKQKPRSSPRSKRLNLKDCQEVRMAMTPDPSKPGFTGSAVLREKCEAADAHKSFTLVFEHRTFDITSITADQCKMLVEGFSALCYHLHLHGGLQGRQTHHHEEAETGRSCLRLRGCTSRIDQGQHSCEF